MTIALAVIVLLAGLAATAGSALVERAEAARARVTIRHLDAALAEWEHASGRRLSWGHDDEKSQAGPTSHYDIDSERARQASYLVLSEVLGVIERNGAAREHLARIDPDVLYTYREGVRPPWIGEHDYWGPHHLHELMDELPRVQTVLDPWGTPIYATHPGAEAPADAKWSDRDGTERTFNEDTYGVVALARRVCFVSAGPDGLFGADFEFPEFARDQGALDDAKARARRDNLHSYQPGRP